MILTWSFRHGSIDVVMFLVAAVQVDTTIMDKFGFTACDLAQQAGHDDITEYLLNCWTSSFCNKSCLKKSCSQKTFNCQSNLFYLIYAESENEQNRSELYSRSC